jgi:CBS domain containing-hemolysin-like protein
MEHGFSRIPVYDRNQESIEGIVLYKDIMAAVQAGKPETRLKELMIPAPYVSANKPAQEVFNRMRAMHVNMAIVLDEYGGLAGIVAMEDIIEQLFGELYDEDEEHGGDEKIAKQEDGTWLIEASTSLFYLSDTLDLDFETTRKVQTLSKYLISLCRDIPRKGDEFPMAHGKFIIESVARRKIKTVKFIPLARDGEEN